MKILRKEFGAVMTNCYILDLDGKQIVIDPGQGSYGWVKENSSDIKGVFLTHGHYDHVYDAKLFKDDGVDVFIHQDDAFLVESDPFNKMPNSFLGLDLTRDLSEVLAGEFRVKFHHYPGHTPGCCMLEVWGGGNGSVIFSGDFLFKGSIGRWDFPFSDESKMRESLIKALGIFYDYKIYPGHGESSTINAEKETIKRFLSSCF